MSVRISGNKISLRRTTNLPTSYADFTVCLFAKLDTAHSTYTSNLVYSQDASGANAEQILVKGGSGLALIGADSYESNLTSTIATLTAGGASGDNWFFAAMRGSAAGAAGLKFYHRPVGGSMSDQTLTNTPGAAAMVALQIGDAPFNPGQFGVDAWWFDGYIAHVKVYSRALSDAEVLAESGQASPVSTTGLLSYHAFTAAALADALDPQQGTGSFVAYTSDPAMSTDNPVLVANPTFSGTVTLPGSLVLQSQGVPPVFFRTFMRK
jgi:hypothetical protein